MSNNRIKVLVVEDREEERRTVINQLQRYGVCNVDTLLSTAGTYVEACQLLDVHGPEIKLVSLDLNIPLDEQDASPDNDNGGRLLEYIHDMNGKAENQIRVIVVSGQDIAKGWNASKWIEQFGETLVGVARKDQMPRSFIDQLQKLEENPLRNSLVDLNVGVVEHYDIIFDPQQRIKERLKSARNLAIQLMRNEIDVFKDTLGAGEAYGDNFGKLISCITDRFKEKTVKNRNGKEFTNRYVEASLIQNGTWASFLWRGSLIQHFFCLNHYRNDYEHIADKPFHGVGGEQDDWDIPSGTLKSLEHGERLGQILELIIGDLLDWYLPWHEQVYVPWLKTKTSGETSS